MKILVISQCSPYPPIWGGATRSYNLLKYLAAGNEIHYLTFESPDVEEADFRELGKLCASLKVLPRPRPPFGNKRLGQLRSLLGRRSYFYYELFCPGMQAAIDEALAQGGFDLIQVESSFMGYYTFPPGPKLVINEQNIEYDIYYRTFKQETGRLRKFYSFIEYKKLETDELSICRKADLVLYPSEREKSIMGPLLPGVRVEVIPNGVDTAYFKPSDTEPEPHTLVFTGSMNYSPNADAAKFFAKEVFPLIRKEVPDAEIYLVGVNPGDEVKALNDIEGVRVTGRVDDVRPYIDRASVFVVPIRFGSGTRLKVVEAMAMGKPMVSTTIGCEGIDVKEGENILIGDTPEEFSSEVIKLLRDEHLREKLIKAGRKLAVDKYDWSVIAGKMIRLYTQNEE